MKEGYYLKDENIVSSGMGFGLGAMLDNVFMENFGLSCALRNVGFNKGVEEGTGGIMPFEVVMGCKYNMALRMPVLSENLFCLDVSVNNYNRTGLRIGSESIISRLSSDLKIFVRLGFRLPAPVENNFISFFYTGLGIKWKDYGLDYGFNFSGLEQGMTHLLTVSYNIGSKEEKTEKPVQEKEKPAQIQPAAGQPAMEKPAVEPPVTVQPAVDKPAEIQPVQEQPVQEQPTTNHPPEKPE